MFYEKMTQTGKKSFSQLCKQSNNHPKGETYCNMARSIITKEEWHNPEYASESNLLGTNQVNLCNEARFSIDSSLQYSSASTLLESPAAFYLEIDRKTVILHVNRDAFRGIEGIK